MTGPEVIRAAVFRGLDRRMGVEEITLDPPAPTEILVRMKAVGLCHTEQHILKGEWPMAMTPMILGHEGAGVVEAVGAEVRDIVVGDHVALLWMPACRACSACQRGEHHRCEQGHRANLGPQFNGSYRRRDTAGAYVGALCMVGAFAEKTVVDQVSVVVVERDLPFEAVALSSCCVAGGYGAVANATRVKPGETVLVVGAGGSGGASIQAARMAGAGRIIVADHHSVKLERARQFGATDLVHVTGTGTLSGQVLEINGGQGVDHAIICAGSVDAASQAYHATRAGGAVVQSGIPLNPEGTPLTPLDISFGNGKTLVGSLYGAKSQLAGIPQVLDHYRCGHLHIDDLITRTYSLDELADGFDDLAAGKNIRGVVVFD